MSDINVEKILKLLRMTTSDNDNEAVIAIRQVNKMLNNAGLTWDKVIVISNGSNWEEEAKKQQPKPKQDERWKEVPIIYDSGFFKAIVECEPFTSTLNKTQRDMVNEYIDHFNRWKYVKQADWARVRIMWDIFRREYEFKNRGK